MAQQDKAGVWRRALGKRVRRVRAALAALGKLEEELFEEPEPVAVLEASGWRQSSRYVVGNGWQPGQPAVQQAITSCSKSVTSEEVLLGCASLGLADEEALRTEIAACTTASDESDASQSTALSWARAARFGESEQPPERWLAEFPAWAAALRQGTGGLQTL